MVTRMSVVNFTDSCINNDQRRKTILLCSAGKQVLEYYKFLFIKLVFRITIAKMKQLLIY